MSAGGASAGRGGTKSWLLACSVLAGLWLWLGVVVPLEHLSATAGDFGVYYRAAQALLERNDPYSEAGFIYPPLLLFLVLPLALFPLDTAREAWFVLSQAWMLGAFWLCYRFLGGGWTALVAAGGVWCLAGTVQENLVLGQVNPLLLLLIVAAATLLARRPRLAGALLGTAAALKVWPAALLLALAVRRRWGALGAGVAAGLVLVVVPFAVTAVLAGAPEPGGRAERIGTAAALNFSLPGLVLRLADPPRGGEMPESWRAGNTPSRFEPWGRNGWMAAVTALVVLLSGAALLLGGQQPAPAGGALRDALLLGGMTALAIVASPIAWYHYQVCQFFAMALILEDRLRRRHWAGAALLVVLYGLLTRTHSWGFGAYVASRGWTAAAPGALWAATSMVPLLGLLWFGVLVKETRVRTRRA